jgi:hypothetical protein
VRTAEQLPVLVRSDEYDLGIGPAAARGVHNHAGDRYIGAERYAREHENPARRFEDRARDADTEVAIEIRAGNGLREQARVNVAERGLEAVAADTAERTLRSV